MIVPCAEQQSDVSPHADDSKGDGRDALGVQHVCIVPACGVSEDMACFGAVASVQDS